MKNIYLFVCLICYFSNLQGFEVDYLKPRVKRKIPHNVASFTQGLAIENSSLYESTGLYGQSSVQIIDLETSNLIKKIQLPVDVFGEGIALFPNYFVQITWKEHIAYLIDKHSLKILKSIPYNGQGWGLCRDGNMLWMSDGTHELKLRKPHNFKVKRSISVTHENSPMKPLNDLESVGDHLYINLFQTTKIIKVDKYSGVVVAFIDCSDLLSEEEEEHLGPDSVLNGIAFSERTQTFYLTGKNWPWIFEVTFVNE